jgi:hypothetical protein
VARPIPCFATDSGRDGCLTYFAAAGFLSMYFCREVDI